MNMAIRFTSTLLIGALLIGGCATDEYGRERPLTDAEKGAIIGAVAGAAIGAAATSGEDRSRGVVLGAIGGGLAGGAVGTYMDNQKKDFEKVLAPEVAAGAILIEKMPEHQLLIRMTGETAFDVDSDVIKASYKPTLDKMAKVLNKYGKTELLIVGHTDSTGTDAYNQALSERRAAAVERDLLSRKVIPERLSSYGKGESQPRATNATEEGRRLNRRVEIIIVPVVADS